MFPWSHPNWPKARAKGPLIKDTDSGAPCQRDRHGKPLRYTPFPVTVKASVGAYLRHCFRDRVWSALPGVVQSLSRTGLTPSPGSLPELCAPTLPDHRFNAYGWMLSMIIAREGRSRKW